TLYYTRVFFSFFFSSRRRHTRCYRDWSSDVCSSDLFARLVAASKPTVKFDAWAHHPYSGLGQGPSAKVAFPNVNLTQLPTFEKRSEERRVGKERRSR